MFDKLIYGAAYYPELWDAQTIKTDIESMKEAGINCVRMGEFSWSTLEPHQGDFHADFFVTIIQELYNSGIETIICTPTPTPPVWISYNHPDRMLRDENNILMSHGGRQQVCTNNPFLRERAALIVEKMAEIYGALPGVIGWQIDNELKGNVSECYCEICKDLWHRWLEKRYITIDSLNDAWGTQIWSQHYETFEQVQQPFTTPAGQNPSLSTAYRQFSRDLVTQFVNEQAEIIRKYSELPITHNSNLNHYLDHETVFEKLDFVSFDHYSRSDEYRRFLTFVDLYKTLKPDKPFFVMETAPSFSGCAYGYRPVVNHGYIKAEAAAAYASGAAGFSYWLWRQQRSGIEQLHGSILASWGSPTIGFKNVVDASKTKDMLEKLLKGTSPAKAELAVTYSDRARAFFLSEPLESMEFKYVEIMQEWYSMVLDTGIHRDFIFENSSFDNYKILMSPYLPFISEDYLKRAVSFVEDGGIWIVGPLSGIRTGELTVNTDHALGKVEEICGASVVYNYPLTGSGATGNAFGVKAELNLFGSVFDCHGAKSMGIIEGGLTPGMPFITEYKRGKGKIVMLGCMPSNERGAEMLRAMITYYSKEACIARATDVTPGTIVVPREGKDLKIWVIINMDGKGGAVTSPVHYKDSLTGESFAAGIIKLEPYACKVIEF